MAGSVELETASTEALVLAGTTCYRNLRPRHESPSCDPFARYRTVSGRCNNLGRPEWGASGATLRRMLTNAYADGRDVPRGGRNSRSLLSRLLS